jgi:hypothetical protein
MSLRTSLFTRALLCLALLVLFDGAAWAKKCPNLAILLDRSGSMLWRLQDNQLPQAGERSRWDIATSALNAVLSQYDGYLPIGFAAFPVLSQCGTSGFIIPSAYNTKAAISPQLGTLKPPDTMLGTPTCTAVNALRADTSFADASRAQYILLITDGEPFCSDKCGASDHIIGAVNSITAAYKQTPSVHTFVVGFGGNLSATFKDNLNQMAVAGGEVNPDRTLGYDYYAADSEQALLSQIQKIIQTIAGSGDAGSSTILCDDTCYSNPCPKSGDICVASNCKANPCTGVMCGEGEYCYTDGTTAQCLKTCTEFCPGGERCIKGQCTPDACGQSCPPKCQNDDSCLSTVCKNTQGCFAGKCRDDVCQYITCPAGLQCVPFEGTCELDELSRQSGAKVGGCACDIATPHSHRAAIVAPLLLFFAWLLLFRRRRPLALRMRS